jgi:hypothetical protein
MTDVAVATEPVAERRSSLVARIGPWTIATAGAWAIYRLVLFAGGVRFSDDYFTYGWQLIPVDILRADPLRSLWYLHIQPPLFNALVAVVLRWSPLPDALSMQLVMLASSLVLVVGLQRLLMRIGLGAAAAFVITLIVSCDPELVRYELGATYELPVAAMVVVALLLAARFLDRPGRARFAALTAVLTAIVLTRSLFHPVWLAAFVAVVLWASWRRWRWKDLAIGLVIPVIAIGGWMVKNEVVFGRATLSSWFGMNLQRGVIAPLPRDELDALVAEGKVSPTAKVPPFSSLDEYEGTLPACVPQHAHPAVSRPDWPGGTANFNDECFLPVYDRVGSDAWSVLRERPGSYLYGRGWAIADTVARSSNAPGSRVRVFRGLESLYHVAMIDVPARLPMHDWSYPLHPAGFLPVDISVVLSLLLAVHFGLAVWAGIDVVRRRGGTRSVLIALSSGTVLFVIVIGALFEIGENARFRAMVNPLYVAIPLALGVEVVERWWRSRSASQGGR